MKLCESCRYRNNTEYEKPCIVYRDDCEYYEKERGDMTNGQAKAEIMQIYGVLSPSKQQALDVALEALEQEPCDDAISRQAVQDYIAKYLSQYLYEDVRQAVEAIDEFIGELPPVTPQPKTDKENIHREREQAYMQGYEDACKKYRQEPKWIPVSERMPESCGMYIVTRKIYDCPDTAPIIMSDESWFDGQNTWHNDNRINHERGYLSDVIAWMPLPAPFDTQESEDKE